jgi:putative sigma-54 modulation protein
MDFIFETLHFKASEQLEIFSQKKMNQIFRMHGDIIRAELTLSEGASGNIENQICEILIKTPDQSIVVKKKSSTYEEAIRKAVESAQKIIRRHKSQKEKGRRSSDLLNLEIPSNT